jgi:RNA polymerase sigma-70 factor (ECF subfamily)
LAPLVVEDEDIERINETARRADVAVELARRLPPDQFEALKARVLDERAYAAIAGDLGCSEVIVRMRVSRALKALRTQTEPSHD